jgi:hypothetical protein
MTAARPLLLPRQRPGDLPGVRRPIGRPRRRAPRGLVGAAAPTGNGRWWRTAGSPTCPTRGRRAEPGGWRPSGRGPDLGRDGPGDQRARHRVARAAAHERRVGPRRPGQAGHPRRDGRAPSPVPQPSLGLDARRRGASCRRTRLPRGDQAHKPRRQHGRLTRPASRRTARRISHGHRRVRPGAAAAGRRAGRTVPRRPRGECRLAGAGGLVRLVFVARKDLGFSPGFEEIGHRVLPWRHEPWAEELCRVVGAAHRALA